MRAQSGEKDFLCVAVLLVVVLPMLVLVALNTLFPEPPCKRGDWFYPRSERVHDLAPSTYCPN